MVFKFFYIRCIKKFYAHKVLIASRVIPLVNKFDVNIIGHSPLAEQSLHSVIFYLLAVKDFR
jgi:hypothetical protein